MLSTLGLYEWLRGPRTPVELAAQEALFPLEAAVPFDVAEAVVAARLYAQVPRARGREIDLAVAACALVAGGAIWMLNPRRISATSRICASSDASAGPGWSLRRRVACAQFREDDARFCDSPLHTRPVPRQLVVDRRPRLRQFRLDFPKIRLRQLEIPPRRSGLANPTPLART